MYVHVDKYNACTYSTSVLVRMHAKASMQMCMSRNGMSGHGTSLCAVERISGTHVA